MRVVQDSDEEDVLSPVKEHNATQLAMGTEQQTSDSSGSSLQKIYAAQDALLVAGGIPNLDGANDDFDMFGPVSGSLKRSKTMRTYGSSASKRTRTDADSQRSPMRSGESGLGLSGTLRNDFAQHNPNAMFSERSSTVPDNTMTQQRILQQAIDPHFDHNNSNVNGSLDDQTEQTDSTIPWSTDRDSPRKSQQQTQSRTPNQSTTSASQQLQIESAWKEQPDSEAHTAESVQMLSEIEVQPEASAKELRMSRDRDNSTHANRQRARGTADSSKMATVDEMWEGLPKEQYKPRASRSRSTRVTDSEYKMAVEQTLKPKSKRRKTAHVNASDEEGTEVLIGMGFSPDRARNALAQTSGNTEAAIEILTVTSNKASSVETTRGHTDDNAPVQETSILHPRIATVEVSIPVPMANSKRKLSVDASNTGPEKLQASPGIITTAHQAPPMSSSRASVKRKRRTNTIAVPQPSRSQKILDSDDSNSDEESPLVEPAIESFEKDASARKASSSVRHTPAPVQSSDAAELMPPPSTKRRGRGRPRKSDELVEPADADKENRQPLADITDTQVESSRGLAGRPSSTKRPGVASVTEHEDHEDVVTVVPQPAEERHTAPRLPVAANHLPKTTEQPKPDESIKDKSPEKEELKKSARSHSPIKKGKTTYRVGLSKTARIAPLLRVMRK